MSTSRASAIRAIVAVSLVSILPACSGSMKFGIQETRMPGQAAREGADSAPMDDAGAPLIASDFSASERERILAVQPIVEREAKARDLDPDLVYAVIWVESRFNPKAKSPAGARGLMQLMPATAAHLAKELGEKRPHSYDPDFNIRAGAYYLDRLIERFDGDETLAIAAYNAGPGNVSKWQRNGDDLPDYSKDYVAKVAEARNRFSQRKPDPAVEAPAMLPAKADTEVILVQRPTQKAEPDATAEAIAQRERQVVPEPEPIFDEPVFEVASELDVAPEQTEGNHRRVAVRDAGGRWPMRKAEAKPEPKPEPEIKAENDAPEAPKLPEQKQSLPEIELPGLPGLDDEAGASSP